MSTTPLWHKEGTTIDEAAMAFMSKDDVFLDRHLFRYDIRATEAHVRGSVSYTHLTLPTSRSV